MKLKFWGKSEQRNVSDIQPPVITTSEQNEDAIGLIFGKFNNNNIAQNLSSVFRAVSIITNGLNALPIVLFKTDVAGNKTQYKTHPVYKLLNTKVNKFLSVRDWITAITTDVLLKGNGYSIIHFDGNGKVEHLEYVSASKVSVVKKFDSNGELAEILYNVLGHKRLFQDYEMIHIKNSNLNDDCTEGISVLKFASKSMSLAHLNEQAASEFAECGGRVSGIVSVTGQITSKQKQHLREEWLKSQKDSHGVIFLSGMEKYEQLGSSAKDLELLSARKWTVDEVARWFSVHPSLLYSADKTSYASQEQSRLSFLQDTLAPFIYAIESELENKLLSPSELERCEIKFSVEELLRTDSKTRLENMRVAFNLGIYSINEMRGMLDLPAIEDADEHYLQAQLVTLKNSKHLAEQQLDNNVLPKNNQEQEPVQEQEENKNNDDENNE